MFYVIKGMFFKCLLDVFEKYCKDTYLETQLKVYSGEFFAKKLTIFSW